MSHPHQSDSPKVRQRRGPRYRLSGETSTTDSESLRAFRDMTDGLSNQLPLPSLEGMRAGAVNNPISLMRRFLIAMRSAGLSKERAIRVQVWLANEINARWPMEQTSLEALEQRAMALEAADDAAEKCHDLKRDVMSLRERLSTQMAEIAADEMVAAKLARKLEEMEGCK